MCSSDLEKLVQIKVLDDLRPQGSLAQVDPFEATLVGQALSMITIVLPDLDSDFARRIIRELTDFLS